MSQCVSCFYLRVYFADVSAWLLENAFLKTLSLTILGGGGGGSGDVGGGGGSDGWAGGGGDGGGSGCLQVPLAFSNDAKIIQIGLELKELRLCDFGHGPMTPSCSSRRVHADRYRWWK